MVLPESAFVAFLECWSKLHLLVRLRMLQRRARKAQATQEPEQALRRGLGFLTLLGYHELLKSHGLSGMRLEPILYFLQEI